METYRRRLVWSAPAKRDLLDIWSCLAEAASSPAGDEALRKIDAACKRLRSHPFMGRPRDQLVPELRSIFVDPHVVFYRIGKDIENLSGVA